MPAALRRIPEPLVAAAGLAVLLVAAFLVPGRASHFAQTPSSIMFEGLVDGLVISLATMGIVLVYSSVRVINFAQTAIGVGGAVLCFDLMQLSGLPFVVAFPLGLAVGMATGAAFQLAFGTRFAKSPRVVLTLVTVFAGTWLAGGATGLVSQLPFLPPPSLRPLDQQSGNVPLRPDLPFGGWSFSFSNYPAKFGFPEILSLVTALLVIGGIVAMLRYTRLGKAIRASAENAERASLLGISIGLMALLVWTIAGGLSALSAMLQAFEYRPSAVINPGAETLLVPITAAVLANMRNLWTAIATTVGLIVLSEAIGFQDESLRAVFTVALFALLVGGLLLRGRSLGRLGEEATSWSSTAEVRPVPRELSRLTALRIVKWGSITVGLAAIVVAIFVLSLGAIQELGVIMLTGVVALSVVILTGWGGQASFGQYAIAAVGALVAGWLSSKVGLNAWLAIPIATLVATGVGTLMAFPALRIRGLFLVAVTFAFAVVARALLFDPNYFGWLQPDVVKRPAIFFIDFADERWMYLLAAATLVVTLVVARNLRRSRFGRLVIAGRENEASLEASGVSGMRIKLSAFAAAGALAGLAGALLAFEQYGVNADSYGADQSLLVFEMAVVGGVSSIWGGLLGVAVIYALTFAGQSVPGVSAFLPALPLVVLYISPGGILGMAASARDAVLRIIARRRRILVPSLYGDADAESLEKQVIPLAPTIDGALSAFQLVSSRLSMGGSRGRVADRSREAVAIGAALAAATADDPAEEEPV